MVGNDRFLLGWRNPGRCEPLVAGSVNSDLRVTWPLISFFLKGHPVIVFIWDRNYRSSLFPLVTGENFEDELTFGVSLEYGDSMIFPLNIGETAGRFKICKFCSWKKSEKKSFSLEVLWMILGTWKNIPTDKDQHLCNIKTLKVSGTK